MKILYACSNCSNELYKKLNSGSEGFVLRADQKYHNLLLRGLAQKTEVLCLSGLPVNRKSYKKLICKFDDETEDQVKYHYYTTVNLPAIRQVMLFLAGFNNVLKHGNKDTKLICDYQNVANAYGVLLAAKLKHIPSAAIVMDLPDFIASNGISKKIYEKVLKLADGYVLLTEQMNEKVNLKQKPYAVIEGIADSKADASDVQKQNYVMYAGSLERIYGIQNLVEGFISAKIPDTELWIYGDGDYREELEQICKLHKEIIYKGVCSNEEVVEAERKALLLVNPRPSEPEYTEYSFPSKTMEYMASGTAVLTTKLPGIPEEYNGYLYFIEDESPDGIATAIKGTLEGLIDKKAQQFVLTQKNEIIQAQKVIDLYKAL